MFVRIVKGTEMKKFNKKNGMILGEVIFALFICGILLGISIYMFKSNDVSKTPFIYAVMKNLPEVNKVIAEDCFEDGTCGSNMELPDDLAEYCQRLSDNFATSGAVNCSDEITDAKNTFTYYSSWIQNFRFTNGVAFYNINQKSGWQTVNNNQYNNQYIDIFMDINGANNGDNTLGTDIFPLRIFKNGDVVPYEEDDYDARDDEEFFGYRIVLNKASDDNTSDIRTNEVMDANNGTGTFREKVSYTEAVCLVNPELFEEYFDETNICSNIAVLDACNFDDYTASNLTDYPHLADKSAYCTVEFVKPRAGGIFKLFGV